MGRPTMYGPQWTALDVLELHKAVETEFGVSIMVSQGTSLHEGKLVYRICALATLGGTEQGITIVAQTEAHWPSHGQKHLGGAMAWCLYRLWTACDASEAVAAAKAVLPADEPA